MPQPSRTGLFKHLEKGAALSTGERGEVGQSNESVIFFLNIVFICEFYNTGIRFSLELRATESGRRDFWQFLSDRGVGAGCPRPQKETPGCAGHWQRRCRGRGCSRTHPGGAAPEHPRHPRYRSCRSAPAGLGAAPGPAPRPTQSLRWD